nr:MAG TPA: hypothetical protein [Caudoviricetes sp.]
MVPVNSCGWKRRGRCLQLQGMLQFELDCGCNRRLHGFRHTS